MAGAGNLASDIGPASSAADIVAYLRTLRSDENIAGMSRYGIVVDAALGISNPAMQKIARLVGKNRTRAFELWRSGIREARMLALYTLDPETLTADDARRLASDFASWEIVDAAADLFIEARLENLISEFAADEREFVRRAAFAMIASAAVHLKKEPDASFLDFFPLIERYAIDDRNFVKKAVNWALRNIGKRNRSCHGPALAVAERLAASTNRTAAWIGRDAIKDMNSAATMARFERKAKN